jgi:hypothetical protein
VGEFQQERTTRVRHGTNLFRTVEGILDRLGRPVLQFLAVSYLFKPLDAELIAPVLERHGGNVTLASVELEIDSARLRAYVKNKPELLEIQQEAKEQLLDRAESVVGRALNCDNPHMRDSASRFVLERIGRDRELAQHSNVIDIRTRQPMIITWLSEANE